MNKIFYCALLYKYCLYSVMNKKLEKKAEPIIFGNSKIRTSNKGDLCLVDVIDVSNNKINKKEMQKNCVNKTYEEDGNIYVSPGIIANLLKEYKTSKANELLNHLEKENIIEIEKKKEKKVIKKVIIKKDISDTDSDNINLDSCEDTTNFIYNNNLTPKVIQNMKNNKNNMYHDFLYVFEYSNKKFNYIIKNINEEKVPFFKGKNIADFLGCTDKAICKHVDEDNKFKLIELLESIKFNYLTHDEKNTVYISEYGIYDLVKESRKPDAKDFTKFVKNELLPTLRKTGSFTTKGTPKIINSFINQLIKDTSLIENFYNENNIITFFQANVFYLIVVGMIDRCYVIKFGHSMRIFERDYNEHKKTYGEQAKVIFVAETDNNILVETLFKKFLETKNALFEMEFGGKNRTELFKTSQILSIKNAIEAVGMLIEKNPSNAERKVREYNKYELLLNTKLEIAKEKTKQIKIKEEERTKQEQARTKAIEKQIELDIMKEQQKDLDQKNLKAEKSQKKEDNDMYLRFLNECTKESKTHLKSLVLYEAFNDWYKSNYPNTQVPTNRTFYIGVRNHKDIYKVKCDGAVVYGIKNLQLISDN
jgi:prophage antirepressor-like protein